VGQVWMKRGANFYLLDQWRDRVDFTGTMSAVVTMTGKHPHATAKLVEDAANGPAIISMLQSKIAGIIAVPAKGSKLARAQAVTPLIEAGNVYLPEPSTHPWVHDFMEECAAFKGVDREVNDQVDAMTQGLSWLNELNYHVPEMDIESGSFVDDASNENFVGGFV